MILQWQLRHGGSDAIGLTLDVSRNYSEIRLVGHELRSGGLWVSCENTGKRLAQCLLFSLKVFEEGKLVDQYDLFGEDIPEGQTTDQILKLLNADREQIDLAGRRYEITFRSAQSSN